MIKNNVVNNNYDYTCHYFIRRQAQKYICLGTKAVKNTALNAFNVLAAAFKALHQSCPRLTSLNFEEKLLNYKKEHSDFPIVIDSNNRKKRMLVFTATYDHNGAFKESPLNADFRLLESRYHIRFVDVNYWTQMKKELDEISKESQQNPDKKIDVLLINAHGNPDEMVFTDIFNPPNEAKMLLENDQSQAVILKTISVLHKDLIGHNYSSKGYSKNLGEAIERATNIDAKIILNSCSTGASIPDGSENIAQKMAFHSKRKVYARKRDSGRIIFNLPKDLSKNLKVKLCDDKTNAGILAKFTDFFKTFWHGNYSTGKWREDVTFKAKPI